MLMDYSEFLKKMSGIGLGTEVKNIPFVKKPMRFVMINITLQDDYGHVMSMTAEHDELMDMDDDIGGIGGGVDGGHHFDMGDKQENKDIWDRYK